MEATPGGTAVDCAARNPGSLGFAGASQSEAPSRLGMTTLADYTIRFPPFFLRQSSHTPYIWNVCRVVS
jgi:hypothetical protein